MGPTTASGCITRYRPVWPPVRLLAYPARSVSDGTHRELPNRGLQELSVDTLDLNQPAVRRYRAGRTIRQDGVGPPRSEPARLPRQCGTVGEERAGGNDWTTALPCLRWADQYEHKRTRWAMGNSAGRCASAPRDLIDVRGRPEVSAALAAPSKTRRQDWVSCTQRMVFVAGARVVRPTSVRDPEDCCPAAARCPCNALTGLRGIATIHDSHFLGWLGPRRRSAWFNVGAPSAVSDAPPASRGCHKSPCCTSAVRGCVCDPRRGACTLALRRPSRVKNLLRRRTAPRLLRSEEEAPPANANGGWS